MRLTIAILISALFSAAGAQVLKFPYTERFDGTEIPELPPGWGSTYERSDDGDFITVKSSAFSDSIAVVSTNARIGQSLSSPLLDFSLLQAESLTFYERRSASHNSDIIIEASIDGGAQYITEIGDTLRNPGNSTYVYRSFKLPCILSGSSKVRIRWRVLGNGTGSTGTVRLDDICVSALYRTDVSVSGIKTDPLCPVSGDDVRVIAEIRNAGLTPIAGVQTELFEDLDSDGFPGPSELVGREIITDTVDTRDNYSVEYAIAHITAGSHKVILTCSHPDDTNFSNDTAKFIIGVGHPLMSIVINEIMYDPVSRGCEYVEIYNPGEAGIDMTKWKLSDEPIREDLYLKHLISDTLNFIDAGKFIVIARDSSVYALFPDLYDTGATVFILPNGYSLSNGGDEIMLFDQYDRCMDSVHYSPDWHNPYIEDQTGRSLERINPRHPANDRNNWSTSANLHGGTPGKPNSILTVPAHVNLSLSAAPNPFSPDGDGYEDLTVIQYNISASAALIRLRVFDSNGRLIRTLADAEPGGSHGEYIWDGYNEKRQRVIIGLYIILFEALNDNNSTIESVRSVIAVAAKL